MEALWIKTSIQQIISLFGTAKESEIAFKKDIQLIRSQLLNLSHDALIGLVECKHRLEDNNTESAYLSKTKEKLYSLMNDEKKRLGDCEGQIALCQHDINLRQEAIGKYEKNILDAQKSVIEASKKLNATKKDLWWAWVTLPTLIWKVGEIAITKDIYDNRIKDSAEAIKRLREEIGTKTDEIYSLRDKADRNKETSSELGKHIFLVEQQISENILEINRTNAELATWSRLSLLFGRLTESIADANNLSMVMQCVDELRGLEKEFDVAVVGGQNSIVADLKYRGNCLYPGQILHKGEYLVSPNKRFVAVLTADGNFVVANREKEIWRAKDKGNELRFTSNGVAELGSFRTKRDNAVLMVMQDDGNLVTYDASHKPLWATDTWAYASLDNGAFQIALPRYEGVYKILSKNGLHFDVCNAGMENNEGLQLYSDSNVDNQKFLFEELENGCYKITAKHSGKVFTVAGGSMNDDAELLQDDYHGWNNQHFWILPCSKEGHVKIIAAHSGKAIEVARGDFKNYTKIRQYEENGSEAQMFVLKKV